MNARQDIISRLVDFGIIAVVRAQRREQVLPLSRALVEGGVRAIEITMTTPDAVGAIGDVIKEFGSDALVGVGTVLDVDTAQAAMDAGAEFVVSPMLRVELVRQVQGRGKPVMLGVYTPTEAQLAHEVGSDFVKLFPADGLGPGYIKALRAPFPHLKIVPTGGVDLNTAEEFLRAGCVALGVGSALVSTRILEKEAWSDLRKAACAFSELLRRFREQAPLA